MHGTQLSYLVLSSTLWSRLCHSLPEKLRHTEVISCPVLQKEVPEFFHVLFLPSSPVGMNRSLFMFSKGYKLFQRLRTTESINAIKIVDIMGGITE